MARVRLYCGIVRGKEWFNYVDIGPLKGGVLAMLDGGDKTGAARLLNLVKGTVSKFYTASGDEFSLTEKDYLDIKIIDGWKIAYEQIKIVTKSDFPVLPESFYCPRCSKIGYEHYTDVNESWQKLIEDGFIDEIYLDEPRQSYFVDLPEPFEVQQMKTIIGGTFDRIEMKYLTIGDMIKIHNSPVASISEASIIYATWDAQLVQVVGMSDKDLNILKRAQGDFFSKRYFSSRENQEALITTDKENTLGIRAEDRSVMCKHCGAEIGGYLDQTNFFSPLLPKK